jgi:hypothetical protein
MTNTLRSKHNELEEVTEQTNEEFSQAKLIRRSANQDLVQALKSVKDLITELGATWKENSDLWNVVHYVVNLIRVPEDAKKSWVQFFPVIPECFNACEDGCKGLRPVSAGTNLCALSNCPSGEADRRD